MSKHIMLPAMDRAAAQSLTEMRVGLTSLASISTIAPWLGILATMEGIIGSFKGCGCGDRYGVFFRLTGDFASALLPTAFGIAVGLLALSIFRVLSRRADMIRAELRQFAADFGQPRFSTAAPACLWPEYQHPSPRWRTHLCLLLLALAWATEALAYFLHAAYDPQWAVFRAAFYVSFLFAIAIAPVHAACAKTFGRSQEISPLLTAAVCLIWSVVECVFGLHLF